MNKLVKYIENHSYGFNSIKVVYCKYTGFVLYISFKEQSKYVIICFDGTMYNNIKLSHFAVDVLYYDTIYHIKDINDCLIHCKLIRFDKSKIYSKKINKCIKM